MLRFTPILQVSLQERTEVQVARSDAATPKNTPHEASLGPTPEQNIQSNPRVLQDGPLNSHESSFDAKTGTPEGLVTENMQTKAVDVSKNQKLATCSVATQTDREGCSKCGYIEGETLEKHDSIEDLEDTGRVIEPSTITEVESKGNSTMNTEEGKMSDVNHITQMDAEEINSFKELQVKVAKIDSIVPRDCNQELARTSQGEFMIPIDLQMESKHDDEMDSSLAISPCVIQTRSRTSRTAEKLMKTNIQ